MFYEPNEKLIWTNPSTGKETAETVKSKILDDKPKSLARIPNWRSRDNTPNILMGTERIQAVGIYL